MEEGNILILKNLDSIYGSLYDMLNQNYTVRVLPFFFVLTI